MTFFDQQTTQLPAIRITEQPLLLIKNNINRLGYKFITYFRKKWAVRSRIRSRPRIYRSLFKGRRQRKPFFNVFPKCLRVLPKQCRALRQNKQSNIEVILLKVNTERAQRYDRERDLERGKKCHMYCRMQFLCQREKLVNL